jgi:predicted AAA+ superfamily ATPase
MKQMAYIKRRLNLERDLRTKSVLLLGPRQTGKSSLIENQVAFDQKWDLLEYDTYSRLLADPTLLRKSLRPDDKVVVIDEIQKLPPLMDEVHALIEKRKVRFLLTGSSARKLKRTHTSLLGGRARMRWLFPLVSAEVGALDLTKTLNFGLLPPAYTADDPWSEIRDYVGLYIREEILAEALVRNLDAFSRFLKVAAHSNSQQLNFEKIGSDAQVPARTVREYFHLLEDTLIGTLLEPFHSRRGRKTASRAKFYFFDCGVVNAIQGVSKIFPDTDYFGHLFEQWIFNELKAYAAYSDQYDRDLITFWRTDRGTEVDFLWGGEVAIEVKATSRVQSGDLKGLLALKEDQKISRLHLVSQDPIRRKEMGVELWPWRDFLTHLWAGEITG